MVPKTVEPSIDFHQFRIGRELGEGLPPDGDPLCLLSAISPTSAVVRTGVASGVVRLTCVALDEAPAEVDPDWEDICEVSLHTTDMPLLATGWEVGADVEKADRLDGHGSGTYRLRVHARGRDTDVDGAVFEPVEDYLILGWPAPHEAPQTLRAQSGVAQNETRPICAGS